MTTSMWLILWAAITINMVIYNFGTMLAATVFHIAYDEVRLFYGPALLRCEVRGVTYRLGVIPWGGYVQIRADDVAKASFISIVITVLSGCLALFVTASLFLPIAEVIAMAISGFRQVVVGAMDPRETGTALIASIGVYIRDNPFQIVLGATAAKVCASNLLPIPGLPGGQIFLIPMKKYWPKSESVVNGLNVLGLLVALAMNISWIVAACMSAF
jgi:membrane-associated protease RseP (regulator of RpoE activity)